MSLFPNFGNALSVGSPRSMAETRFFGFICSGKRRGEIHCPCRARSWCVCDCHSGNAQLFPRSNFKPEDVEAALVAETEKVIADNLTQFQALGLIDKVDGSSAAN